MWRAGTVRGVSLQDALKVNIINNTIASNDTTASSGVLFNTIGAPEASTPPGDTNQTTSGITSAPAGRGRGDDAQQRLVELVAAGVCHLSGGSPDQSAGRHVADLQWILQKFLGAAAGQ